MKYKQRGVISMNLQPLFETQKKLDKRIIKEKGLEGVDLLDKKILALQVELGELANEWRGFKFWSEDRGPRKILKQCITCGNQYKTNINACNECEYIGSYGELFYVQPLLEEYVDCLHFILSIGNDYDLKPTKAMDVSSKSVIESFFAMFEIIPGVKSAIEHRFFTANGFHVANLNFQTLLNVFGRLGKELGFTWEQIEQAYYDKNKVNQERQANGY